MLSILIVALLVAHISCDNTNQANGLSSNDNDYGAQGYRELNGEFRISVPSQFEDDSQARYRRSPYPQRNGYGNRSNSPPCPKRKPGIRNAFTKCSNNICTATCKDGNQLPNGKTSTKLQCIAGQWVFEGIEKNDKLACEPKGACPMKPESKQAETTDCGSSNCTITCAEGFALPDGSTSMKMTCKNGKWESADPEQNFAPECESMCDSGRVYKECSKTNEKSCGSAEQEELSSSECIQGCFCPDGTVEHDGDCIQPDKCPETGCNFEGQTYAPGQEVQKDCNTCKCVKGEMKCTEKECAEPDPARCEVFGDPHYRTFDGKRFDFMGKCAYYLMRMDYGLDVIAENGDCPSGFSKEVSCTKSVTMRVPYGEDNKMMSVALKQRGRVEVNGRDMTHFLPMTVLEDYMTIRQVGPEALMATFLDGMQMVWDGSSYAYIDSPGSHSNRTKGLCGNFDGNPDNDFATPDGEVQQSPDKFANEWRVKEMCDPRQRNDNVPHPCQRTSVLHQQQATNVCAKLNSNIFSGCNVDRREYINNCIYDLCACKGDMASCMCTIFSAYANECSRNGTPIKWRDSIPECAMKCPAGQVYEECSKNCYRSCADLQTVEKTCTGNCIAGCRCPEEQALDENQRCIPTDKCPCVHNGRSYNSGNQQTQLGPEGLQSCTCKEAKWKCESSEKDNDSDDKNVESIEDFGPIEMDTESTTKDNESTERAEPTESVTKAQPPSVTEPTERDLESTEGYEKSPEKKQPTEKDIESKEPNEVAFSPAKEKECLNDKSKKVSQCLPTEPKTCKNMINYRPERIGECKTGCVCKDEFVLDTESNQCVESTNCGCEHEGKNYQFGSSVKKDCNACICQSSEWYCTNRKCDTKKVNNNQESSAIDKRQADAAPPKSCQPSPLTESKTIGLVQVSSEQYGKCANKQPIRGLAVCRGACSSGTKFNAQTLQQEQQCTCCSVVEYNELSVPVDCDGGPKGFVKIQIPKSCSCQTCTANENPTNDQASHLYEDQQPAPRYGLRIIRFFNPFRNM